MFGLAPEAAFTPTQASPRVEYWRQFDSAQRWRQWPIEALSHWASQRSGRARQGVQRMRLEPAAAVLWSRTAANRLGRDATRAPCEALPALCELATRGLAFRCGRLGAGPADAVTMGGSEEQTSAATRVGASPSGSAALTT